MNKTKYFLIIFSLIFQFSLFGIKRSLGNGNLIDIGGDILKSNPVLLIDNASLKFQTGIYTFDNNFFPEQSISYAVKNDFFRFGAGIGGDFSFEYRQLDTFFSFSFQIKDIVLGFNLISDLELFSPIGLDNNRQRFTFFNFASILGIAFDSNVVDVYINYLTPKFGNEISSLNNLNNNNINSLRLGFKVNAKKHQFYLEGFFQFSQIATDVFVRLGVLVHLSKYLFLPLGVEFVNGVRGVNPGIGLDIYPSKSIKFSYAYSIYATAFDFLGNHDIAITIKFNNVSNNNRDKDQDDVFLKSVFGKEKNKVKKPVSKGGDFSQ